MPGHFWEYFDPDGDAVFTKPVPPVEPVLELPPTVPVAAIGPSTPSSQPPRETPDQQIAREHRHEKKMDTFFKLHTIYRDDRTQLVEFFETDAKLRERIKATVSKQKAAPLLADNTTRQWLIDLRRSWAPKNFHHEAEHLRGVQKANGLGVI